MGMYVRIVYARLPPWIPTDLPLFFFVVEVLSHMIRCRRGVPHPRPSVANLTAMASAVILYRTKSMAG